MNVTIDEVKHVNKVLGESCNRKFGLHAPLLHELKVTCKNATGANMVEYSIQNSSNKPQACVLYRGVKGVVPPYYFGNAFFAAYYSGINGTRVADYYNSLDVEAPNSDKGAAEYSLGLLSTGTREYLTCFVFIVPGRSGTLRVLEGGIQDSSLLLDVHAYLVGLKEKGSFKQFFSQIAMRQYTVQSGYSIPAQDPYFVKGVVLEALEENIPTNEVFANQHAEKVGF